MSEKFISSVHIQKLGHNIQEIRERALQNIVSKLDNGFIYDNDLARTKEILSRLFEWFLFEPCTMEDEVLRLICKILKTESGLQLIQHYGHDSVISEMRQIRTYVEPKYFTQVDEIIKYLNNLKDKKDSAVVPPLISDLPLSYRSDEDNFNKKSDSSKPYGTTATSIRGFVQQDSSSDQRTGKPILTDKTNKTSSGESYKSDDSDINLEKCLPFLFLSWQPLVAPDRHVLESIEESLQNPPHPSSLIHSCEFFTDVMLQDFPAEVFIQRPTIVILLLNLLSKSTSTRLSTGVLKCLQKLTKYLVKRISYYSDPSMHNLKQNTVIQMFSGVSTPPSSDIQSSERSNLPNSPSDSENNDKYEDTALLKTKQMCLPNYCISVMIAVLEYISTKPQMLVPKNKIKYQAGHNAALELIDSIIYLMALCIKPEVWYHGKDAIAINVLNRFNELLVKLGDSIEHYRLEVGTTDCDSYNRVMHLGLLQNSLNLVKKIVPVSKMDFIFPRNLKNALCNSILDATFARLYSSTHASLYKIIKTFGGRYETDSLRKYDDVKNICESITAAIRFIKTGKSLPTLEAIKLAVDGVFSLEFHKSLTFIKTFIEICANKLPLRNFNENILKTTDDILLKLLAHHDQEIRVYTYKLCKERIIATVGPKLNTTKTGAPGSQVQFLLRSDVLMEIITHGVVSENETLQECSEDILIHLLKCKILVSDRIWNLVIEAIIPCLPMLVCHANKKTALGRTIMNILDPDVAKSLYIPPEQVFKANTAILFLDDGLAREEAVARLCWLLSLDNEARDMLPRLNNLRDKSLSFSCQLNDIYDLNKSRTSQQFYQPSNVQQILEMLKSANVEPVVRRSALTQLAVMMEDPLVHVTFVQNSGIDTILTSMQNALKESDYHDYPDSIIPAITILKYLCVYNSSIRQQLGLRLEALYYALRGLFLFCTEERVKQDGSILLFLMLFGNATLGSPAKADLSVLKLLSEKLKVPFKSHIHGLTSRHSMSSLKATIASDKWSLSSVQIQWNSEWYGGFKKLLEWEEVEYDDEDGKHFDELMRLSNVDLRYLKSSNIGFCVREQLNVVQNGTSHEAVSIAVNNLVAYVHLYMVVVLDNEVDDILEFDWEETFSKYLQNIPSGEEDVTLLISVVKLLHLLVPMYKISSHPNWIVSFLKNPCCMVYILLQDEVSEIQNKILNREILELVTDCACAEQNFLQFHSMGSFSVSEMSSSWSHVVEIIAESLKFSDAQHFYNLAYLDCLLSSLVHLSATLGWSKSKASQPPKRILSQLVTGLCDLVGAFHCSKGSTAPVTLMGISITRHVVLILNHLLAEMQYCGVRGWDRCFLEEDLNDQQNISSLCAIWLSRDVVLRAAVLQLFAGLALSPRSSTLLINEFHDNKMNILEVMVSILLDHEEASIVRENVATLFANLISHTTLAGDDDSISLLINFAQKDCSSLDSVLVLLDENNFYKELEKLLSNLHLDSKCYYNAQSTSDDDNSSTYVVKNKAEYAYAYMRNIQDVTVRSLSSSETKSSDFNGKSIATPGLIKAVANLLNNLLPLAYEYVVNSLQEYGLIKLFFRALCNPAIEIKNTKDISLYCDILEMNASICQLLTRAVKISYSSLGTILHTRDCLNVMLSYLDPSLYFDSLPQLIYLRNRLWIEVFGLISALIDTTALEKLDKSTPIQMKSSDALNIISSVLNECNGHRPFLKALCESISTSSAQELQQSALMSLTSLLKVESTENLVHQGDGSSRKLHEDNSKKFQEDSTKILQANKSREQINEDEKSSKTYKSKLRSQKSEGSMQNILDSIPTPRTPLSHPNIEKTKNTQKNSDKMLNIMSSIYFGNIHDFKQYIPKKYHQLKCIKQSTKHPQGTLNKRDNKRDVNEDDIKEYDNKEDDNKEDNTEDESLMAGAELCKILLHLYDCSHIKSKTGKQTNTAKQRTMIISTLTSMVCVSHEAKKYAFENGLLELILNQLQEINVKLSLESVDCLRRVADKKRLTPILKETGLLIGLLMNFLVDNTEVKNTAATYGLADICHKLWSWFNYQKSMLVNVLKLLCTYTTNCILACQSLPLTSPVAGTGPRKIASNLSLLHAVLILIGKEMEQVSKTHDLTVLKLAFHLLQNSCCSVECRILISKCNLFQHLSRLHPAITKKQKPWDNVELLWLNFLGSFTGYPEGQACAIKVPDVLEVVISLALSTKSENKLVGMEVLRNVAFYQPNRSRLLTSGEFLNVLRTKITSGNMQEKNIVVLIMWALAANNQKAKLVLKCAGLDAKLKEVVKLLQISEENVESEDISRMHYVLNILKDSDKLK